MSSESQRNREERPAFFSVHIASYDHFYNLLFALNICLYTFRTVFPTFTMGVNYCWFVIFFVNVETFVMPILGVGASSDHWHGRVTQSLDVISAQDRR